MQISVWCRQKDGPSKTWIKVARIDLLDLEITNEFWNIVFQGEATMTSTALGISYDDDDDDYLIS